jgi:hypothetical protein
VWLVGDVQVCRLVYLLYDVCYFMEMLFCLPDVRRFTSAISSRCSTVKPRNESRTPLMKSNKIIFNMSVLFLDYFMNNIFSTLCFFTEHILYMFIFLDDITVTTHLCR